MLVHQPAGPFYLGGHSFGATIAYEMARQLVDRGHEIGLLAINDQRRPGWRLTTLKAIPALPRILASMPSMLWNELAQVAAGNRLRYVRRRLLMWSKATFGLRPDAIPIFDVNRSKKDLIKLFDAQLKALRDYRPVRVAVPMTLFRAKTQLLANLALDSTLGWSEVTGTEVRLRVVPGDHQTITTEPIVRQLAKTLSDELDMMQGVARTCATLKTYPGR